MIRSVLVRALFVAIGAAAAGLIISRRAPTGPSPSAPDASPAPRVWQADVEQRLKRLEAGCAQAALETRRLADQLATITARGHGADEGATAREASGPLAAAPEAAANAAADTLGIDDGKSAMERALTAAGLDAATVADIKRRHDGLALAEIYLRDQATREHWLDSPRFAAEMAAIEAQRTPLRNEIGDDAYDRYLFALGQTNRVRVDEVLTESPAAQAGLQAGDVILRYGNARLFAPGELVDQTRGGTAGEAVQIEIVRNGERLEVEVPRGPLGLRVAATQGKPEAS